MYTHYRLLYEEKANEVAVQFAGATKQHNLKDTFAAIKDLLVFGFGREQAFDLETTVIEYVGLDVNKLCEWCTDLGLREDVRYTHLINVMNNYSKPFQIKQLNVFYTTFSGKPIPISISNDSKIKDVKRMIAGIEGLQIKSFRLVYDGKRLRDDAVVMDCGIGDGSMINLLLCYEAVEAPSIPQQPASAYTGVHSVSNSVQSSRHNPMTGSQ